MTNTIEAILDRKIEDSCRQIRGERTRTGIVGSLEVLGLLGLLAVFFAIVYFIFWGPGYSVYAKAQHDHTVSMLLDLPGPHRALVQEAIETNGYVSLTDYRRYVAMASGHNNNEALSAAQ